jgi:hypothetical protein
MSLRHLYPTVAEHVKLVKHFRQRWPFRGLSESLLVVFLPMLDDTETAAEWLMKQFEKKVEEKRIRAEELSRQFQLNPFSFLLTEWAPFRTLVYPAYPANAYIRAGGSPGRYLQAGLPPV